MMDVPHVSYLISMAAADFAVYRGDVGNDGQPRSVYSLDQSLITAKKLNQIGAVNLKVGQTQTFAGGVTVRFDGYKQWASMQVSHDPTQQYLAIAAAAMVCGLIGSLSVRRRRVWLRLVPGEKPGTGKGKRTGTAPTLVSAGGFSA